MIQNEHMCIQVIFGGWSVPRCGQYFGGDPGALNTQLFSPRCLSCFETRDIFLVIKNKSCIILVIKMIYYE